MQHLLGVGHAVDVDVRAYVDDAEQPVVPVVTGQSSVRLEQHRRKLCPECGAMECLGVRRIGVVLHDEGGRSDGHEL